MTRSNTPDRVGFCAVARDVPPDTYMPDLVWRLRVDESRCLPGYLEHLLASEKMRSRVTATASGTSASMRKINKRGISTVCIPLPEPGRQAAYVETCEAVVNTLTRMTVEVDALRAMRSTLLTGLMDRSITVLDSYDNVLDGPA